MTESKLFTSESVSPGHPDKVSDQISDAFLDACLKDDSESKVACETLVTTGMAMLAGEIRTETYVPVQQVVRQVLVDIGYTIEGIRFDSESVAVLSSLHSQSDDINQGVENEGGEAGAESGAGDQGMMFGFACDETDCLMPAPIYWAHKLMERHVELLKSGDFKWLRPDAKSQVTFRYEGDTPVAIEAVVLSTQTAGEDVISIDEIRAQVEEHIVRAVLPAEMLDANTKMHINPTGRFVIGGPHGDAGLTGRKIIVDTYGGMARHGGGAFSGKDPSKVDRSAAYATRWIAKNIVAAGLAVRCEVQVAYAIGVAKPLSIRVDTFGSASNGLTDTLISEAVRALPVWNDDKGVPHDVLTPDWIIGSLQLRNPQGWTYQETASLGHFGRDIFPWENLNLVDSLKVALNGHAHA